MDKQSVSTGETPHVFLQVHGNLRLKGSEDLEVTAKADSTQDLTLEQQGEEVRIRSNSNCTVRLPREANLDVELVNGNAEIKALDGELRIGEVDGNLDLRSVGPAWIEMVHGNLTVKHVDGDLNIRSADSNVTVRDVTGSFSVSDGIKGNLNLDDVSESVSVKSEGNQVLRFDPHPGARYEFTADGNILCRLPDDASARIHVTRGSQIIVSAGDVHLTEREKIPFDVTLGEGDAELAFSAGGNVNISGQAPDWEMGDFDFDVDFGGEFEEMASQIGRQVAEQIESQVNMIEQQISAQMENLNVHLGNIGLSPEQAERIAARAREASARATARAQERMQHAQERIQRKMEAVQRKVEQKARVHERRAQREKRSWSFEWPTPPAPPGRPARPPAPEAAGQSSSDEERLMILRMLQEKKITAEEAEQLLAALEGGGA